MGDALEGVANLINSSLRSCSDGYFIDWRYRRSLFQAKSEEEVKMVQSAINLWGIAQSGRSSVRVVGCPWCHPRRQCGPGHLFFGFCSLQQNVWMPQGWLQIDVACIWLCQWLIAHPLLAGHGWAPKLGPFDDDGGWLNIAVLGLRGTCCCGRTQEWGICYLFLV